MTPTHTTIRRAARLAGILSVLALGVGALGVFDKMDLSLARRIDFQMRSRFSRDPSLDPRLKIFLYDDPTVAATRTADLPLLEWTRIVEGIAAREPRAIIFDKLFDLPRDAENSASFVERMRKHAVAAGAFVIPVPIAGRTVLADFGDWGPLPVPASRPQDPRLFAYGPIPEIRGAFRRIGHMVQQEHGLVDVFHRVEGAPSLIPHLGFAASSVEFRDGELVSDGHRVPVDSTGKVLVNMGDPLRYLDRTYSLNGVIRRLEKMSDISVVSRGDVVLILPSMYTGNTTVTATAFGNAPGGFLVAALASSAISGAWLTPLPGGSAWLILFALFGTAVGTLTWARRLWLAIAATTILVPVLGLASFIAFGVYWPWLSALVVFHAFAWAQYVDRSLKARLEEVRMMGELATAKLVQASFFPKSNTAGNGLEVEAHYIPASECCGDWWWHASPKPGTEIVVVADAMGHGAGAALVTGITFSCLETLRQMGDAGALAGTSPSALLDRLNGVIFEAFQHTFTVSMFVAVVDLDALQMHYAVAGYPGPLLFPVRDDDPRLAADSVRRNLQRSVRLHVPSNPLGVVDTKFKSKTIALAPGDKIIIATDGAIEQLAMGKVAKEANMSDVSLMNVGRAAITDLVAPVVAQHARAARDALVASIVAGSRTHAPHDDMTMVILGVPSQLEARQLPPPATA